MDSPETTPAKVLLQKVLHSRWAVWGSLALAVVLLCLTATVAFALKNRFAPRPAPTYSPMAQLEEQYQLTDLEVTTSDGLGVAAGSAPVAPSVTGGGSTPAAMQSGGSAGAITGQAAAPRVGPAPAMGETPALQPMAPTFSSEPPNLLQAGAGEANVPLSE